MRQNGDTDKMVGEMLSYPDVVACILYAEIATEAVIEYLIRRMQVSKGWYAHITLLLKNAKWLAPFVRSAQRFVCSLVHRQSALLNLGNGSGAAIALVRSDIIVSYVAGMNLHMFDENSQLRALWKLQLILKSKTLRTQNFMSIVTVLNKVMDKHVSAAGVQIAACAVIQLLAKHFFYAKAFLATGTVRKVISFMRLHGESRSVPFSVDALHCTILHTFFYIHAITDFCMYANLFCIDYTHPQANSVPA